MMDSRQDVIEHNSNHPANSTTSDKTSAQYKKIIDKLLHCVNDHLLLLMNQLLSSADNKLFDQAEKAKTDELRMQFMDCTRIFRTERNDISHHFFINLNAVLSSSPLNAADSADDELRLVGHDEMEEMVAITTMHSKAMNIYGEEVANLVTRLEYLEIMCENSFDKEAIDPKHICEIFQKTIENIDIAIEVKLIFYKLFDQEVVSKLGVMYKCLNQIFVDNGIMPEIILKTTSDEEVETYEEEVSSRVASYYDPLDDIATDFIPRTKQDVSRIVNEFMTGGMTITGDEIELPESFLRVPTQQDIDGKNCYQRKEVIRALSNLQRKLTSLQNAAGFLSSETIKQELLADISRANGGVVDKNVNLLDERSIDFVGMMFGAITDDDTVSELMTSLIYQLQIPVMKIAMSDNTLFDNDDHPTRVTLDLLTAAGKGINVKEDHLYSDLVSIVDDILDSFDVDISAFEHAVEQLQAIISKENEATVETEKKQQKLILQSHAKNIVITQLKMVSCNKKIPEPVRPLVLKNWSTLMLNRYIRHGRESAQWIESVMLLKLLLKCMQPIQYPSQFQLVKNNHLALIEAVNDELYQTQQDRNEIAAQIANLKSHFLQMIDEYGYKIVDDNNETLSEEQLIADDVQDTQQELEQIQQQTAQAKRKIAQLTGSTKPGVWYEIFNGEDKPVRRLKLSVILTDAAQLIFVDRKGVKVIEKDAEDFARELQDNRSRLLADHSTFDHALGNVIKALAA